MMWNTYKKLQLSIFNDKAVIWKIMFLNVSCQFCFTYQNFIILTNTCIKMAMAIELSTVLYTSAFFCQLLFIHNYHRMIITAFLWLMYAVEDVSSFANVITAYEEPQ